MAGIVLPALLLLLAAVREGSGAKAQISLSDGEKEEILSVVRGGVEDNSWWRAKNRQELEEILSRYYTEPLLHNVSGECWKFIRRPTDWYDKAYLKEARLFLFEGSVFVEAELELADLNSGRTEKGEAEYLLKKTKNGWRIYSASYHWP